VARGGGVHGGRGGHCGRLAVRSAISTHFVSVYMMPGKRHLCVCVCVCVCVVVLPCCLV
jgi:hypothetical protein